MSKKSEFTPQPPKWGFITIRIIISPPWGLPAGRQGFRGKNKKLTFSAVPE